MSEGAKEVKNNNKAVEETKGASVASQRGTNGAAELRDADSVVANAVSLLPGLIEESGFSRLFAFGSAECEQFETGGEEPETRRPVEISFLGGAKVKVARLVCGSQHCALLSWNCEVFTFGNSDNFCLGRPISAASPSARPGKVDLPFKVDLLAAGDCFTVCANSVTGVLGFWGTIISATAGKLKIAQTPETIENYYLTRKGIRDLRTGSNHVAVLSGGRVFTWGDGETGALGTDLRQNVEQMHASEPTAVGIKSVERIFTTFNNTFFVTKFKVLGCGLNNYNQLGLKSFEEIEAQENEGDNEEENKEQNKDEKEEKEWGAKKESKPMVQKTPVAIPGLEPSQIEFITGGEHHSLILDSTGRIFGSGRNDDGQLGEIEDSTTLGNFRLLNHLPPCRSLTSTAHFNYALDREKCQFYSWGFGSSYVLGNGKEDSLEVAFHVSNEKLFKCEPSLLAIGYSHVVFSTGPVADPNLLRDFLLVQRKKRLPASRSKSRPAKRVNK